LENTKREIHCCGGGNLARRRLLWRRPHLPVAPDGEQGHMWRPAAAPYGGARQRLSCRRFFFFGCAGVVDGL